MPLPQMYILPGLPGSLILIAVLSQVVDRGR